jgi:hypothetical protein
MYTNKTAENYLQNITLGKNYFAVQPLRSNQANGGNGGCAVTL